MKNFGQIPKFDWSSLKKPGGPNRVCVLPEPVYPYMKMVQLTPDKNESTKGGTSS